MKTKEIKIGNLVMVSVAARLIAVAVLCVIALSGCDKENFEPEQQKVRTYKHKDTAYYYDNLPIKISVHEDGSIEVCPAATDEGIIDNFSIKATTSGPNLKFWNSSVILKGGVRRAYTVASTTLDSSLLRFPGRRLEYDERRNPVHRKAYLYEFNQYNGQLFVTDSVVLSHDYVQNYYRCSAFGLDYQTNDLGWVGSWRSFIKYGIRNEYWGRFWGRIENIEYGFCDWEEGSVCQQLYLAIGITPTTVAEAYAIDDFVADNCLLYKMFCMSGIESLPIDVRNSFQGRELARKYSDRNRDDIVSEMRLSAEKVLIDSHSWDWGQEPLN